MGRAKALDGPAAKLGTASLRNGWKRLGKSRRALLELLSLCAISDTQARRIYDKTERVQAGIAARDEEFLANPYLLFELDRKSFDPISFGAVDRGFFPDEKVRKQFPVEGPSRIEDPADARRVRSLVVDLLEDAAAQGHTVQPQSWVIRRARERALQPPCPLGEGVLEATQADFAPVVAVVPTGSGEPGYQIDHLATCREIIRKEVTGRRKGKLHAAQHPWRSLVDRGLGKAIKNGKEEEALEERARVEKSAALEQRFRSRLSLLIGPAGTDKTTLLQILCDLPECTSTVLLLLPTPRQARGRLP